MVKTSSKSTAQSLLRPDGPVCLIITATLKPVGNTDRFQPAGFPEVGHVIYDAPRTDGNGNRFKEKVCIVNSPASMANHLESVCVAGAGSMELHGDLRNLPYVICQTDGDVDVVSTFTEGHRLASDYFLDATQDGESFRNILRSGFQIVEVKKDKTYFIPPAKWWDIYKTIFKFDPNSLVHGVMFAKEQIKISRLLTAHLEAFGASRVGRAGVKFDRLGKTTSGQPIFSVDEETAHNIRATFIIDLALLRSYGRGENGLNGEQKKLLLDLAVWKIRQLLGRPFRYARLPQCPTVSNLPPRRVKLPADLHIVQFAVGGRVYPTQAQWVRLIDRFRGCVLKHAARIVSGGECASYRELSADLRDKLRLLSGKDGEGRPVRDHQHAYFFFYPDELGNPTRLIAYRHTPFDTVADPAFEVESLLAASREPVFWQGRDSDWSLRIVPLPFETPAPSGCRSESATAAVWISATPFVPPNRQRFRKNGRLRAAETATALLKKALTESLRATGSTADVIGIQAIDSEGNPVPIRMDQDPAESRWVTVHETQFERRDRLRSRTRPVRPGFRFRVEFSERVPGPLLAGHSCHFGLGLFVPEDSCGLGLMAAIK